MFSVLSCFSYTGRTDDPTPEVYCLDMHIYTRARVYTYLFTQDTWQNPETCGCAEFSEKYILVGVYVIEEQTLKTHELRGRGGIQNPGCISVVSNILISANFSIGVSIQRLSKYVKSNLICF